MDRNPILGREVILTGSRNNDLHDNFAEVNKFEEIFVEMCTDDTLHYYITVSVTAVPPSMPV
jgi:hypothetical protein